MTDQVFQEIVKDSVIPFGPPPSWTFLGEQEWESSTVAQSYIWYVLHPLAIIKCIEETFQVSFKTAEQEYR